MSQFHVQLTTGKHNRNLRTFHPFIGMRTAIFLLTLICLVSLGTLPVAAQEASEGPSLLERLHAARAVKALAAEETTDNTEVAIAPLATPPLPFEQPQLGPLVKPEPFPVVASNEVELVGMTGVGYGRSSIGSGLDILKNADDMEQRSTEIALDQIASSENFAFPEVAEGERWIRVDLGNQQVVAYEGLQPVRAFIVSTGLPSYPTVTGEFRVRMKVAQQIMSGPGYYLPGVKWVMYFYDEYALHGSYWHSNFGNPMSHGCVNMTNADAKWLFDWAGPVWDEQTTWFPATDDNPGTRVIVHL